MSAAERFPMAKVAAEAMSALRDRERQRQAEATLTAAAVLATHDRAMLRAWWDTPPSRRDRRHDAIRRGLTAEARRELGRKPTAAEARAYASDFIEAYTLARMWLRVNGTPDAPIEAPLLSDWIATVRESAHEDERIEAEIEALLQSIRAERKAAAR